MAGALVIAVGIGASRLLGLVRERVIAHALGMGPEADALRAALKIPNLLQNLLGEGTLSASFLPAYARLRAAGRHDDADRLATGTLAALFVLGGLLVLAGAAVAPGLVALLAPGFVGDARFDLTVPLLRLTLPMTGLLVLSAWALGVLNAHRKFALPYLAPVAWNLCIIGAFVWAAGEEPVAVVRAAGVGCLVGGAAQVAVQLPAVMGLLRLRRPSVDDELRGVLRTALPAVWGRGVVQISGYVDHTLATLLGTGAVATLSYAQTLVLLPSSLFGLSVAQATLPDLATTSLTDPSAFAERVRHARSRVILLAAPSAVALALIGDRLVAGLLQTGAFDADAVRAVSWVLLAASPGVLSGTTSRVTVASLAALGDTATPARSATVRVVASGLLGFGAMALLEPLAALGASTAPLAHWSVPGVAGLVAAASLASVTEAAWLSARLERRAPGAAPGLAPLARHLAISLVAAGAGRVAAAPVDVPFAAACAAVVTFGLVWSAGVVAFGPEADRNRVRAELGRLVGRLADRQQR